MNYDVKLFSWYQLAIGFLVCRGGGMLSMLDTAVGWLFPFIIYLEMFMRCKMYFNCVNYHHIPSNICRNNIKIAYLFRIGQSSIKIVVYERSKITQKHT